MKDDDILKKFRISDLFVAGNAESLEERRIDQFDRIMYPEKPPKILTHGPPFLYQGYRFFNDTHKIHRPIRLDWLVNNNFIKFTESSPVF